MGALDKIKAARAAGGSAIKPKAMEDDPAKPPEAPAPDSPSPRFKSGDAVRSMERDYEIEEDAMEDGFGYKAKSMENGESYMLTENGMEPMEEMEEEEMEEARLKLRAPFALVAVLSLAAGATMRDAVIEIGAIRSERDNANDEAAGAALDAAAVAPDLREVIASSLKREDGETWEGAVARAKKQYPSAFKAEEIVPPVPADDPAPADKENDEDPPADPAPVDVVPEAARPPKGAHLGRNEGTPGAKAPIVAPKSQIPESRPHFNAGQFVG